MATQFLDLTGLTYYDSKLKAVAVGSAVIEGSVLTLKSIGGTTIGTATIPQTAYDAASDTADGLMSASDFTKLSGIAEGATKVTESATNGNIVINGTEVTVYEHPTFTAHEAGLYNVTIDGNGHVSVATAVTKSDITALGIAGTDTTYDLATASTDGLMSSSDYSKLAGIESEAQVNVIESVSVNGEALAITSKNVNIDLSEYAKTSDITNVMTYKGTVDSYADLPTDASVGDVYNITNADSDNGINAGDNVAWNGTEWDVLAGSFTMEAVSTTDIDALFE